MCFGPMCISDEAVCSRRAPYDMHNFVHDICSAHGCVELLRTRLRWASSDTGKRRRCVGGFPFFLPGDESQSKWKERWFKVALSCIRGKERGDWSRAGRKPKIRLEIQNYCDSQMWEIQYSTSTRTSEWDNDRRFINAGNQMFYIHPKIWNERIMADA